MDAIPAKQMAEISSKGVEERFMGISFMTGANFSGYDLGPYLCVLFVTLECIKSPP